MPFESNSQFSGLSSPLVAQPDIEHDFVDEILPAAFRQENTIGSAITALKARSNGETHAVDPDFDGLSVMRPEDADYMREIHRTNNAYELKQIENRIDAERKDREILHSSGWAGMGGIALATLADPTVILMPGGAAFKAAKFGTSVARSVKSVATAGAISGTLQESILQGTQLERTALESAINIAAATVISGALGGAIGATKHGLATRALRASDDDAIARVANDLTDTTPQGGSTGAARVRDLSDTDRAAISTRVDELVAKGKLAPDDADKELAAQVATELLRRDGMKTNWAVDSALKVLGHLTPELRMLNSPSAVVRELLPELAEPTVTLARNQLNEATPLSAEAMVRDWKGNEYRSLKFQDDQYVQYAEGRSKRFGDIALRRAKNIAKVGDDKMAPDDFNEAVAKAMIRGDDATAITGVPADAVPFINKTAANWRKEVITPMTDIAIAQGRLPEGVTPKTAASYFMRMYDIDKLTKSKKHRNDFLNTTTDWLTRKQSSAKTRIDEFEAENAATRAALAGLRQQISAIETGVKKGTASGTKTETTEATDAALKALEDKIVAELVDATKVREGMPAKANAAAIRTFFKTLRKELAEEIDSSVGVAVEREASKALNELLEKSDDIAADELMPIIRDELTEVGTDVASDAAGAALPKALQRATDAAAEKAEKALVNSIKAQERELKKLLSDPAAVTAKAMSQITRNIAKVAATEAGKAARAATKDLRKELTIAMKDSAKRKKLNARDLNEAQMSRDEFYNVAEQILGRIVSTPAGRMPYDMATKPISKGGGKANVSSAAPLHERAFGIEDELIENVLVMDAENVMRAYIRSMAPDLALHEKGLSGQGFETAIKRIEEEYSALKKEAKTDAEVAKLEKRRVQDEKDVLTLRDRLLNVHGLPDDPTAWSTRVGRGVLQYNYVTKLGGMTAAAFADMGRTTMVHGLTRTIGDGIVPMLNDFKGFSRMTRELRAMGLATDMINNSRMNSISDTLGDDFARGNRLERALGGASNTFGMVSLMAPWNTVQKQFAGVVSISRLTKAIGDDVAGTIGTKEREWLRDMMIGEDHSRQIAKQLGIYGEPDGAFVFPNVGDWKDKNSARLFRASLGRQVDQIIVTPGIGDKPTSSTSTMAGRIILQFKGFGLSATSRIMMSGLQQADIAALNGVILSVTLGAMSAAFKTWDAGRGDEIQDWTVGKWLTEGVDRSGVVGILSDGNNVLEKVSRGTLGMSMFTGGHQASRYANRNLLGAVGGPTVGAIASVGGVAGNALAATFGDDRWRPGDTDRLIRTLPYSNLSGLRQGFKAAADSIDEAMGVR
tara:strand:+ start:3685 stop:7617 length:3933 start_codon:yes stop_codon:yes gene_type:complete